MQILLLFIVAIGVSIMSAFLTVSGYTKLFTGATYVIASMLIALELAKVSIASIIVEYKHLKTRLWLIIIMLLLVVIASIGHYGYLSNLYFKNQVKVEQISSTMSRQQYNLDMINSDIERVQSLIDGFSTNYNSKRLKVYNENKDELDKLITKRDKVLDEMQKTSLTQSNEDFSNLSTMIHSAKLIGIEPNQLAQIIIITISFILDPLALLLVASAANLTRMKKEEELQDEIDIHRIQDMSVKGITVSDIVSMSDSQIKDKLHIFDTKARISWLKKALVWREMSKDGYENALEDLQKIIDTYDEEKLYKKVAQI